MANGQTPMLNLGGANTPPEYLAQQQQLNRQQQLAQLLMQQGQSMPSGQMVSGRYVAPSFFQYAAPLFQTYAGMKLAEKGDKAAVDLAQRIRNKEAEDINKFFQYQYGSPRQVTEMTGPYGEGVGEGNKDIPMPVAEIPEVQRNPQMAYQIAAQSQSPILRQQLAEMLKGRTVKEGETYYRYNPLTGKEESVLEGGMNLPSDIRSAALRERLDPRQAASWTDADWSKINQRIDAEKDKSRINLTVNTGKAYTGAFGEGIAKEDLGKYSIAEKAPTIYQNAINTEQLLNKGAITGLGAEFKLNLARALNVAGAENSELIKNTEQLVANRGQIVLDSIKASGLGAGQGFTDKDRQFLEKVKGGTIELNVKTLRELARIEKNVAQSAVDAWNKRLPNIPREALQGTGVGPIQLQGGGRVVDFNSLPK